MTPITEDDLDANLVRQADPESCFPPTVNNVLKLGARTFDIVASKSTCLSSGSVNKPITLYSAPGINDTVRLSSKSLDLQTLDSGLYNYCMTKDLSRDFVHGFKPTRPDFAELKDEFLGASVQGGPSNIPWSGETWTNITAGFLNSTLAQQCREVARSFRGVDNAPVGELNIKQALGNIANALNRTEAFAYSCAREFQNVNGTTTDEELYWSNVHMVTNCEALETAISNTSGWDLFDYNNMFYQSTQMTERGQALRNMCDPLGAPLGGTPGAIVPTSGVDEITFFESWVRLSEYEHE